MISPLVSVKMITYNHAPYIAQAIEGVLQQRTSFPFELVIGEDCSTDDTRKIVFDYAKRYPDIIRVITSEHNVGMSINGLRTGQACMGKYIAWCEGDDYWHHPEKLQKQVGYLEANNDCAFICSDYDIFYQSTGKRICNCNRMRGLNPSNINNIKYVLRGTPTSGILTCTVVARMNLFHQALEYNAEIHKSGTPQPCGDTPMWTELARRGSIAYIDESLSTYRQIPLSATHNPSKIKLLQTSISMKEQMLYLIRKYGLGEEEEAKHIRDLWLRRLKLAYYKKDAQLAQEAKKNLIHLSPMELVQFYGAHNSGLNYFARPFLALLCRNLIPTTQKD